VNRRSRIAPLRRVSRPTLGNHDRAKSITV
jgi:hypothetical protein